MLKHRIITSIILIPLVLGAIFYLPFPAFAFITAVVFLLAAWEWTGLIGYSNRIIRASYLAALGLTFILFYWVPGFFLLPLACIGWGCILYFVLHYEKFTVFWARSPLCRALGGGAIFLTAWYGLNFIRSQPFGPYYILLLLLFIWGADIGAYFIGRAWGKVKLAPKISPGKSREGAIGGALVSVLIAFLAGFFFSFDVRGHIILMALALGTASVSVLGDLFESMVKRQAGVKDSGNLLPGHGGLLDRIDSLLSAAPIFALGMLFL